MTRARILKTMLKRMLLLGAGIMAGALLIELGLRVMGISYPLPYVPDPYCGSRLRPGMEALFSVEGRAVVQINQDGLRDREHTVKKPAGTFRIAVLGDSFAEAFQVSLEETFWSVMQRQLQASDAFQDVRVEVLNFGVSGFGTAQELEMLRHYVWRYEPDLVLLAFLTGNDISENSKQLSPDGVRPYFKLQDGRLVLDQSFREHPLYLDARTSWSQWKVASINRLRILQLLREYRTRSAQRRATPGAGDVERDNADAGALESGLDPIYSEPRSEAWKEAWEITERLLLRMRDEVNSEGAEFCVVTLSNGLQVHPDPEWRKARIEQTGVDDLFYADRRIRKFGQQNEIRVVTLAPRLQQYAEKEQVYLHGFPNTQMGTGHWNERGHRAAGKLIARELAKNRHQ